MKIKFDDFLKKEQKVGDYVIVNIKYRIDSYFKKTITELNNNICKIMEIAEYDHKNAYDNQIRIVYKNYSYWIDKIDIIANSENKEDLEPIIAAKKYNII